MYCLSFIIDQFFCEFLLLYRPNSKYLQIVNVKIQLWDTNSSWHYERSKSQGPHSLFYL